jgi:hypothetical protein
VSAVVSTQTLAGQLLAAIGAPTTAPNIAAMTAWLNSESTHTASTITAVGNNPLNISTGADVSGKVIGTSPFGPGIAQYASMTTGVQATAQYLAARQPGIIAGFKAGNGTAAVTAITASNYVTGGKGGNQYGGALLGRFQAILPSAKSLLPSPTGLGSTASGPAPTTDPNWIGPAPSVVGGTDQYLGAWNNLVTFPVGKVITQADVTSMMTALQGAGYFTNDPLGAGQFKTQQGLNQLVGAQWTQDNLTALQGAFGAAANATPGTNLVPDIPTALAGVGSTVTSVATYLAALFIIALGVFLYSKGGQGQEAQVAPGY